MSTIIKPHPLINQPTPEFCIPDAKGRMFKFPPEEQGQRVHKPIAVFFYRESGTLRSHASVRRLYSSIRSAGATFCTREACQFRDALTGTVYSYILVHGNICVRYSERDLQADRRPGYWDK